MAIEEFGLNPREIPLAALGDDILGYVEFHIEQGPVLEAMKRPLGVVDAIAGQSRLEFIFVGPGQPCRYDADASALRCDRGRGGVDHGGGAGSEQDSRVGGHGGRNRGQTWRH